MLTVIDLEGRHNFTLDENQDALELLQELGTGQRVLFLRQYGLLLTLMSLHEDSLQSKLQRGQVEVRVTIGVFWQAKCCLRGRHLLSRGATLD